MSQENARKSDKQVFAVKSIVFIGVYAAVIAVLTQVAIPTPWGIPITLQTLAVALTGFSLGKWQGTMATGIYLLTGLVGVPVYTNFGAGPGKLFGITGGFIWGFLALAFTCGLEENIKKKWTAILLAMLGLIICHGCGVLQFAVVSGRTVGEAFLMASAPYIIKDVVSIIVAHSLAIPIRRVIQKK